MTTDRRQAAIDEVVAAFNEINAAERRYRALVRKHVKEEENCAQVDLEKALGRHRESLRQDAMTDEELREYRDRERERQANIRAAAKAKKG